MEYDEVFRSIMAIGLAVIVPFALYFRLKSNMTGETLDRLQEGVLVFFGIRISALFGFGGLFAYLINPEWMRWSAVELPLYLRDAGVAIGAIASVLWILTFKYLGNNLTDTVIVRKEATLVTNGPYKYMRHPFYVVIFLLAFANGLAAANWFIFFAILSAFYFIMLRLPKEEERLLDRFGIAYREYMEKTPAFGIRLSH